MRPLRPSEQPQPQPRVPVHRWKPRRAGWRQGQRVQQVQQGLPVQVQERLQPPVPAQWPVQEQERLQPPVQEPAQEQEQGPEPERLQPVRRGPELGPGRGQPPELGSGRPPEPRGPVGVPQEQHWAARMQAG